jgi:hypothetical protein
MAAAQMQGGEGTASIQEYNLAKSQGYDKPYTDFKREFEARAANTPAQVLTAEWFQKLTPEQKAEALAVWKSSQQAQIGGVPYILPPGTGSGFAQPQPLSTPDIEAAGATRQAEAAARGTATGAAGAALPQAEQGALTALETIDSLRNHPGRVLATGASRIGQGQRIIGTDAYDFEVQLKQAKGQVFLTAYQALKGSGNITEVEGQKAEQAIARMDASQSEGAFLDALDDLELVIRRGVETARKRAGAAEMPDVSSMSDEELKRLAGGL